MKVKERRLSTLSVIIIILIVAAILAVAAFSGAAGALSNNITVTEKTINTKSPEYNYVTGRITFANGQTVNLYDSDGNIVARDTMDSMGVNKTFALEVPHVDEGTSNYYVAVAASAEEGLNPQKITVNYTPVKQKEEDEEPAPQGSNPLLNSVINQLCWPYGTGKGTWSMGSGDPKSAYVEAAKKYLGGSVREIKLGKRVAFTDCSYFVATVIRMTGVDPKFRALRFNYADNHEDWVYVSKGKYVDTSKLIAGDVIQYKKKGGGNHTMMYIGNGLYAQASRHGQFPHVFTQRKPIFNASNVNVSSIQVIRNTKLAAGLVVSD